MFLCESLLVGSTCLMWEFEVATNGKVAPGSSLRKAVCILRIGRSAWWPVEITGVYYLRQFSLALRAVSEASGTWSASSRWK